MGLNDMVKIRVLRPIFLYGARVEAGREIFMVPADAAGATSSGRCEYINPDDRTVVTSALRAEDARLDKLAGPDVRRRIREWVHAFEHP